MIDYADLRKEQAEKRARGELMGIGISSFTEIVGAGPSHDFDILGIKMFDSCEIRVHPTGKVIARLGVQSQGQGHETTFAQIIAEELGFPVAGHQDRGGRHRHRARTAWAPTPRGRRRSPARPRPSPPARSGTRRASSPPTCSRLRGRPRVGARQVQRQGLAGPLQDDPGDRVRGLHQPSAGDGGRPRGGRLLRSAEPDLPVRQLHLRRRHRQGHRPGQRPALRGHRRLRQHHQPDDRRRADPRRPDDGPRPVALRGDHLRRARQQHGRHVHGLPPPDRRRDARPGRPARRSPRRRITRSAPRGWGSRPPSAPRRPSPTPSWTPSGISASATSTSRSRPRRSGPSSTRRASPRPA